MTSQLQIRLCHSLPDFHTCVALQRSIWGEADLEVEPYVTFVVAAQTGGQVIAAFDAGEMVGFTLSLVGLRDSAPYLHSHMTGVLPSHRDRGVGRLLKLFQREEALSRNIRRIEWTFDPLETRNAHFNFNRLGAFARKYIPNFYGVTTSPLHRGIPTDRLLAEWLLDSPRVLAAIRNEPLTTPSSALTLRVPNFSPDAPPASIINLQSRIREQFLFHFANNFAATSVLTTPLGADYQLIPWNSP
jgi:predicted GNAT superfamily acetyltransferase